MRLSFKVIIWFWVGLLVIIASLFYGAYSKLEPKTFIALLNDQAQVSYPGSVLTVGKIDYKFSVDFNLNLQNISLKRGEKILGTAGEVELKVPWWLLLFNRGNAQINLTDIIVYVEKSTEAEGLPYDSKQTVAKNQVKLVLPHYLTDAHYTLRVKNLTVKDIESERRYFSLSKFLIREFQYNKNSAFEVNIPIKIHHRDTSYNSELWLFGDVTPRLDTWELNYRGEFKTKEVTDRYQIEDLVIDGKSNVSLTKANIASDFSLLIEKKNIGKGQISVRPNELLIKVNFTDIPVSYLSLVGEEVKNPFLGKLTAQGDGFLEFSKSFDREGSSKLNGKLGFEGEFKFSEKLSYSGKWMMAFENSKWETSFLTPKAEVSFYRRAFVDYKEGVASQYTQEIGFTELEVAPVLSTMMTIKSLQDASDRPYSSTLISFKKCLDTEKPFEGSFRYGVSPEDRYYQVNINSNGALSLNYQQKSLGKFIDIEMKKFNWRPFYQFLNPFFSLESGLVDGKVSGRWSGHWSEGQWLVQLKENEVMTPSGLWNEFSQQLAKTFDLDLSQTKASSYLLEIQKNVIKIKNITFLGAEESAISGQLSSEATTKSVLSLNYPKNKKWKPVKKDVTELFWKKEI